MKSLPNIRACVFDAYGTLFDYASAAEKCRDALGDKFAAFTGAWRDRQLQYTWLRSMQGRHADFWQVTGDALDHTMETLGIDDAKLCERLMQLYLELDAFPEVPETLRRLKQAGMRTAILSNGTPKMLDAIVTKAGIGDLLDDVLSVEDVGVFKTDPRVYQLALDRLGLKADEISFQSSNGWDAWAASAFGMRVVWCNRYGQKLERMPGKPDFIVKSLAELPAIVGV
ncbi:(S)-2-haloacid dehalogenase 4A [Variibacter gotjawalensis]|uniref:(S)-2-haloacid dehalogenase n=1 Tax=Variibacter gotjawalensis TaxID=1333996 RepID=A0A0S3PQX7_9BRAD|nr:haloacid dehalogenase type II [Variibacter gotjawalensis]NIK48643.1 2-haloacid dehalogenase [Variibacter gotjawalensis]RZS50507.1 2-haloacid dehalogenase [Variibacter gotjawalensis]BAT58341.1 (S)-2-haloacid dehalogenase 4A [Variibacter gotjawalensis]